MSGSPEYEAYRRHRAEERFSALAGRIARSGADGVLIGGDLYLGGAELLKALRARLGPGVTIMAGGGFESIPDVLELAGPQRARLVRQPPRRSRPTRST